MPFDWKSDTNTGPSTSTLRVEPDQVLQLKAELQSIHDEVEKFVSHKAPDMIMRPLGADPVSFTTAHAFNENAKAAVDAAWGYLDALKGVLDALNQAAETYNLVDETNAAYVEAIRKALQ